MAKKGSDDQGNASILDMLESLMYPNTAIERELVTMKLISSITAYNYAAVQLLIRLKELLESFSDPEQRELFVKTFSSLIGITEEDSRRLVANALALPTGAKEDDIPRLVAPCDTIVNIFSGTSGVDSFFDAVEYVSPQRDSVTESLMECKKEAGILKRTIAGILLKLTDALAEAKNGGK